MCKLYSGYPEGSLWGCGNNSGKSNTGNEWKKTTSEEIRGHTSTYQLNIHIESKMAKCLFYVEHDTFPRWASGYPFLLVLALLRYFLSWLDFQKISWIICKKKARCSYGPKICQDYPLFVNIAKNIILGALPAQSSVECFSEAFSKPANNTYHCHLCNHHRHHYNSKHHHNLCYHPNHSRQKFSHSVQKLNTTKLSWKAWTTSGSCSSRSWDCTSSWTSPASRCTSISPSRSPCKYISNIARIANAVQVTIFVY